MSIFDDFDDLKDSESASRQPPPPANNRNWRSCLGIALVTITLMLICTGISSSAFLRFGMSSDITEYIGWVEESNLDSATRRAYVDRLDDARENIRDGNRPSFFRWLDYDNEMTDALSDYEITEVDLDRLDRFLNKLEEY